MPLNVIAWLVSIGVHAAFLLAILLPESGGAAFEEGSGSDIMVVEQGIAIEGFAKLGEDAVSVQAVEAPPVMSAAAQPLEQVEAVEQQEEIPVEDVPEVEPVEDTLLTSDTGPENELLEPTEELVEKEPEVEVKEQPLPQQVATVVQQTVIAMRESSGEEKTGGSATAHRVYLGKLRVHLEHEPAYDARRDGRGAPHRQIRWRARDAQDRQELRLQGTRQRGAGVDRKRSAVPGDSVGCRRGDNLGVCTVPLHRPLTSSRSALSRTRIR